MNKLVDRSVAVLILGVGLLAGCDSSEPARTKYPLPKAAPPPAPPPPKKPAPEISRAPAPPPVPKPAPPPVPEPAPAPEPPKPPDWDTLKAEIEKATAENRLDDAAALIDRARVLLKPPEPNEIEALQGEIRAARRLAPLLESFAARRAEAVKRVEKTRTAVLKDDEERKAREARLERALREETAKRPLRIVLDGGYVMEDTRVVSYQDGRVKLKWAQGEIEYPLGFLPDQARTTLLRGALRDGTARDHLEIGKLFLFGKNYDQAARCFEKAVALDASLKPLLPDFDRLRSLSRIFEGKFNARGNHLSVSWFFRKAGEEKDFLPVKGKRRVSPRTGIEFSGGEIAFSVIKDIPFRDRLKIVAAPVKSTSTAHLMGIRFERPDGKDVLIYASMATGIQAYFIGKLIDGKQTQLREPARYSGGRTMEMEFNRGRFTFRIGAKTLWSGSEGGFTDVSVVLGGITLNNGGSVNAAFRSASVSGGVNPAWMRKELAGYRDALVSELNREDWILSGEKRERDLSLRVDPILAAADDATLRAYSKALAAIKTFNAEGKVDDLLKAVEAIREVLEADREFAPAWYYLADLAGRAGSARAAARFLDTALRHLPAFPEALASRAKYHILAGEWKEAAARADRALELAPDLPEGHVVRARLQFEGGKNVEAMLSAGVAKKLAPLDGLLQGRAQMVRNLVSGPSWSRPREHVSAHYVVRSDLSGRKCKLYSDHLEGMRPVYERVLGLPSRAKKPAPVLIFNAPEGYFSYLDFTSGDRMEHTTGLFSPWYGQMILYEDAEAEETLNVIAHEGFHQYLLTVLPDGAPIWFNEGMAEYVGATRIEKGKVVETGGIQEGRLRNLKDALKYGWKPLPFAEIMQESRAEFYGVNAAFKYAQAWSMIHFFMKGDSGKWRPVLKEYIERLAAGDTAEEAYEATFAKQDLAALQKAWHQSFQLPGAPPPVGVPPKKPDTSTVRPGVNRKGGTDLLTATDPARDSVRGTWSKQAGALVGHGDAKLAQIRIPYGPPEEYDLIVEVERTSGNDNFSIGLVGGGRQFRVMIDSYPDRGHVSGLCRIDGKWAGDNETVAVGRKLTNNQPATVVCSVRRTGVSARINGIVLFDWKGDLRRLEDRAEFMTPQSPTLYLATWDVGYRFSRIELVRVVSPPPKPRPKIDLIKLALGRQPRVLNGWTYDGTRLHSPPGVRHQALALPCDLPEEYDLRIVATRTLGLGGLHVGLASGDRRFVAIVDGMRMRMSGLELIDRIPARMNRSGRRLPALDTGKEALIFCAVRKTGVYVEVERQVVIRWEGDLSRLSLPREVQLPGTGIESGLFLSKTDAGFTVREVTLIEALPGSRLPGTQVAGLSPFGPRAPREDGTDVLEYILNHPQLNGWTIKDGALVSPPETAHRLLRFQRGSRSIDYTLKMVIERIGGSKGLHIGIRAGKVGCVAVIDDSTAGRSGLQYVDRKKFGSNESTYKGRGRLFPKGKPVVLECMVDENRIRVAADGKWIIDWTGDFKRLSVPLEYVKSGVSPYGSLFLSEGNAQFRISEMRMFSGIREPSEGEKR